MTTFLYAPLLQPLQIGKLTIPNRFCAGPLTCPRSTAPLGSSPKTALGLLRGPGQGGFGLIFTGAFHPDTLVDPVHPLTASSPLKAPKAFQRSAVELLERLDAYGTKMIPQISMGYGRNAPGCFCPSEIPLLPRPRPPGPRPHQGPDPAEDRPDDRHRRLFSSSAASRALRSTPCTGGTCWTSSP